MKLRVLPRRPICLSADQVADKEEATWPLSGLGRGKARIR